MDVVSHIRQTPLKAFIALVLLVSIFYTLFVTTKWQDPLLLSESVFDPSIASTMPSSQGPDDSHSDILLVSAFFPLSKSKHSHKEYETWLTEFLSETTTDIYFFTTPEMAPLITRMRSRPSLPIIIDTTYASPFDIPPLKGLETAYLEMHAKDREAHIHNPELYAIWNAKPFFLTKGAESMLEKTGKTYSYVLWNDAGSFRRKHLYRKWPDPARVDQVWKIGEEKAGIDKKDLLFFPLASVYGEWTRSWVEENSKPD